jgi:predicted branched-subunit amino acid permease
MPRRALAAQLVVDESWAVGQVAPGRWNSKPLVGAGLVIWVNWLAGTVLGALGAGVARRLGLDVAFLALFLALLAPQLRTRRAIVASGASALLVVALVPGVPPGIPILAASLVCLAGLIRRWARSGLCSGCWRSAPSPYGPSDRCCSAVASFPRAPPMPSSSCRRPCSPR